MKRVVLMIVHALICGMVFMGCSSNKAEFDEKNNTLKIGEIIEITLGEVALNKQLGLSLRFENVNDSRCPIGILCVWQGFASVELHLKTKKGEYDFELYSSSAPNAPSNYFDEVIIEGLKYQLIDVLPYPVWDEDQPVKIIKILVTK